MRILIPEAQAMGSIACIRSLGRAGHSVIAMSRDSRALGFSSHYCRERVLQPEDLGDEKFAEWLGGVVAKHQIDLILPSEGLIANLGSALGRFTQWIPCGPDYRRIVRFMNKFDLFEFFEQSADLRLREHIPATLLMREGEDYRASLHALAPPVFFKADAVPERGLPATVQRFPTIAAAEEGLRPLLAKYGRGIVQQYAAGQGVGVFFLRWDGRVRGTLMHRRIHEVPHTGGVSSFRETWWNDEIYSDALRRIEAMDWWGVGMLEYRWNVADRQFHLMEFNARFWGSLHLALFAGVDFPRLLVDAWAGKPLADVSARPGVRCRYTFPKEIEHVWSVCRDPGLTVARKVSALCDFVVLGLTPSIYSDLWFPGDRGLYWRALISTPGKFIRSAFAH